tara:strand:- start:2199 stop:2339 length:141 start_codon:yes stop_codon:yes gene_type:complete
MKSEKEMMDYLVSLQMEMDGNGKYMEEHEHRILSIQIETLEYCLDK